MWRIEFLSSHSCDGVILRRVRSANLFSQDTKFPLVSPYSKNAIVSIKEAISFMHETYLVAEKR